jgi:hypothetical protein
MKTDVYCEMTPCFLVAMYQIFGGTCSNFRFHILKMGTENFSETLVPSYQSIRSNVATDLNFHRQRKTSNLTICLASYNVVFFGLPFIITATCKNVKCGRNVTCQTFEKSTENRCLSCKIGEYHLFLASEQHYLCVIILNA